MAPQADGCGQVAGDVELARRQQTVRELAATRNNGETA